MIEKFGLFLDKKFNNDIGYYGRCILYITLMLICLIFTAILFDSFLFVIIGSFMINILRNYSSGYHAPSLEICILLTTILFCIFGYISKISINYIWLIYIFCLFSCKNIILKSPVSETDYKDKSKEWHMKKCALWIFIFIICSFIFLQLNLLEATNCILLSIIMVDILLFSNYFNE